MGPIGTTTPAADTTATAEADVSQSEPLLAEALIEEISIDGMCGVY